jgi:hypothetical protein
MRNLSAVVQQVALHLGPPWKFNQLGEPSHWRFEIIDGQGRSLVFCHDTRADRFRIGGAFPRDWPRPHSGDYRSIGVSAVRSPKVIAADVSRRLLPQYLAAFERAAQRRREEQAAEESRALVQQALVKVTGGCIASHGQRSGRGAVFFEDGKAEVWGSGGRVDLELRDLTPERAIQIAALASKGEQA